ncbi:MAG: PqqD family peptide modification chaperone [bacterium]
MNVYATAEQSPAADLRPVDAADAFVRRDRFAHLSPEGWIVGDPDRPIAISGVGLRIWDLAEYPTSIASLCRVLCDEFDIDPDECQREVEAFILDLDSRGLIARFSAGDPMRDRYLHLLKRSLTNLIYPEDELRLWLLSGSPNESVGATDQSYLRDVRYREPESYDALVNAKRIGTLIHREPGRYSHTMVGLHALTNIERLSERIFADDIPGDFVDAGTCRGGCAILMRAVQRAFQEAHRTVWVADTFSGVPQSSARADIDAGLDFTAKHYPWLSASLTSVRDNFRTYDLLDAGVRFLPGLFADTLPDPQMGGIALLRIDADLYGSTLDCLEALYDLVVVGGFVIVDDYGGLEPCRAAVDEFRARRRITAPLIRVNWTVVWWQKDE